VTATAIGSYATATLLKQLISITDSTDDTLLGLICDRVNQYIESYTKQPIAPITSATYLYDGDGLTRLFAPVPVGASTNAIGGFRAVSLLEIAPNTGGTFATVASTDYFLRGHHGVQGPYRWLCLSDLPAGSYTAFPVGRANVRVTATAGWAAIPDDVTETALAIAKNVWNGRQAGSEDAFDVSGQPLIPRYVSGRDKETLKRYCVKPY
jgi:hypothetical protein